MQVEPHVSIQQSVIVENSSSVSESQAAEVFKLIANKFGYFSARLARFSNIDGVQYYTVMLCSDNPFLDSCLYQLTEPYSVGVITGTSWSSCLSELLNNHDKCFDDKHMHSISLPKTYEELLVVLDID